MKSITELREELGEVFMNLKTKDLDPKQAKEMNNAAGKIINSIKVELEYAALRKEKPIIDYLSKVK